MEKPNSSLKLSRRALLAACAVAIPSAGRVFAAEFPSGQPVAQPASAVSSANAKLVDIFATVRDKKGNVVPNLTRDDFAIRQDGQKKETIRDFARQSNLPLTLGLLVDTARSEGRMIETERTASDTFFLQALHPGKDRGFLIHFDREVELLQDLTPSTERLHKALGELSTPQRENRSPDESGGDPNGGNNPGGWRRRGGGQRRFRGGAMLYDAIYLASNDLMEKQSGRKAIIVLGDGVDRGSKVSLSKAIDSAQRAGALVFVVQIRATEQRPQGGFPGGMGRRGGPWGQGPWDGMGGHRGVGYPGPEEPDGKKILQQIAKETGGGYFEYSKKKTLGDIYNDIAEDLQNQYLLGFAPDASAPSGFRKIQVSVKRKGCTVQAPGGYFAGANA